MRIHKRLTASLTLIAFFVSQFSSLGYSQPSEISTAVPYFNLQIPGTLGTVEKIHAGTGPALVHIQTAHGNYEAQKNIQAILRHLKEAYGIKTLFVEGSAFKLHPERLRFFPDNAKLTQAVAEELTRKALIKGPELFLLNEKDAEAYGIEQAEVYGKNLSAFKTVLKEQQNTDAFLRGMEMQIERLTSPYLSKDLRAFLKRLEDYEGRRISILEWLAYLKEAAKKHLNVDLSDPAQQVDWPMLVRMAKLEEFESKLDRAAYPKEKEAFLKSIRRIPQPLFKSIQNLVNEPSSHTILPDPETEMLFEQMVKALPRDFDYKKFPNVNLWVGHLILQSEVKGAMLIAEMDKLADAAAESQALGEPEKSVLKLLSEHRLLKKLFALELTPADYEKASQLSSPSKLAQKLLDLNSNKRVKDISFEHLDAIDSLYQKSLEFYSLAKTRDSLMLENIEKHMKEKGIEKAAVVTGGFHSEPFRHFFEGRGYRYALVSPKISTAGGRGAYIESILQTKAATLETPFYGTQTPAELRASAITLDNMRYYFSSVIQSLSKLLKGSELSRRTQQLELSFRNENRAFLRDVVLKEPVEVNSEQALVDLAREWQAERNITVVRRGFTSTASVSWAASYIPKTPDALAAWLQEKMELHEAYFQFPIKVSLKEEGVEGRAINTVLLIGEENPASVSVEMGVTGPVWDYMRHELEAHDPQLALKPNSEAYLPRLYSAVQEQLEGIQKQADAGLIFPNESLDTRVYSENSSTGIISPGRTRPLKVGFLATAGNPINWGHILIALAAMNHMGLDTVVFRIQGEITYKNVPASDMVSSADRHRIGRSIIANFWPLIRYTDIGSAPGDEREGSEHLISFSNELNQDREMDFYYILGAENEPRTRKYLKKVHQELKAQPLSPKHRLFWTIMQRGEYGRILTEPAANQMSNEVAAEVGVPALPVRLVQGDKVDLSISSTGYRAGDPSMVPSAAERFAKGEGFYGYRRIVSPDGKVKILSREEGLKLDYKEVSQEIAEVIKRKMQNKEGKLPASSPKPMGVIMVDGPSGTGKSTAAEQIAAAVEAQKMPGYTVLPLELDYFLQSSQWRREREEYVTGMKLDPAGQIHYGPYLEEETFFRAEDTRQFLAELAAFQKSGKDETTLEIKNPYFRLKPGQSVEESLPPNARYDRAKNILYLTFKRQSIVVITAKYGLRYEPEPGFYDLKLRVRDNPGRAEALFQLRSRKLKPLDETRAVRFYSLALGPSYQRYADETKDDVDFELNLEREMFLLFPLSKEAKYLKTEKLARPEELERVLNGLNLEDDFRNSLKEFLSLGEQKMERIIGNVESRVFSKALKVRAEDGQIYEFRINGERRAVGVLYDISVLHENQIIGYFDFRVMGKSAVSDYSNESDGAYTVEPALEIKEKYRHLNLAHVLETLGLYTAAALGAEQFRLHQVSGGKIHRDLGFQEGVKNPYSKDFSFDLKGALPAFPVIKARPEMRAKGQAKRLTWDGREFNANDRQDVFTKRTETRKTNLKIFTPSSIDVFHTHQQIGAKAAARVIEVVKQHHNKRFQGDGAVIILPTGSTPTTMYRAILKAFEEDKTLDFSNVKFFNLDEYVGLENDHPLSYQFYMKKMFYEKLEAIDKNRAPKPENQNVPSFAFLQKYEGFKPDTQTPQKAAELYEARLAKALTGTENKKAHLVVLGSGGAYPVFKEGVVPKTLSHLAGGHIGFNEPGAQVTDRTVVISLTTKTKKDTAFRFGNIRYRADIKKGRFKTVVPDSAITLGIANILQSEEVLLLANGEEKAIVIDKAYHEDPNPNFPVTYLKHHANVRWILDEEAGGHLPHVLTPWNTQKDFKWTQASMRQAVLGILKTDSEKTLDRVTAKDLRQAGVPDRVVRQFGGINKIKTDAGSFLKTAIHLNGNQMLPRNEKIVLFSPHPDDDVITSATLLRNLVELGNEVTVVYLVGGENAVRPAEAQANFDVLEAAHRNAHPGTRISALQREAMWKEAKTQVRTREAKSAVDLISGGKIKTVFLDLPYYYTRGFVDMAAINEANDVQPVLNLLNKIKPTHIYYSAEQDPHGAHGLGTETIKKALAHPKSKVPQNAVVWGYRGAYEEWKLHEMDYDKAGNPRLLIMPFDQNEMNLKIKAIQKHASQLNPLFPSFDPREFWERAQERNGESGQLLKQLGYFRGKKKTYYAEVFRRFTVDEFLGRSAKQRVEMRDYANVWPEDANTPDFRAVTLAGFEDRDILVISGHHQDPAHMGAVHQALSQIRNPNETLFLIEGASIGVDVPEVNALKLFAQRYHVPVLEPIADASTRSMIQKASQRFSLPEEDFMALNLSARLGVAGVHRLAEIALERMTLWNVSQAQIIRVVQRLLDGAASSNPQAYTDQQIVLAGHNRTVINEISTQLLRFHLRRNPGRNTVVVYVGGGHRDIFDINPASIPESSRQTDAQLEAMLRDNAEAYRRLRGEARQVPQTFMEAFRAEARKGERPVSELIEQLGHENEFYRDGAAVALYVRGKEVLPALREAAKSRKKYVAANAKWAIREIEKERRAEHRLRTPKLVLMDVDGVLVPAPDRNTQWTRIARHLENEFAVPVANPLDLRTQVFFLGDKDKNAARLFNGSLSGEEFARQMNERLLRLFGIPANYTIQQWIPLIFEERGQGSPANTADMNDAIRAFAKREGVRGFGLATDRVTGDDVFFKPLLENQFGGLFNPALEFYSYNLGGAKSDGTLFPKVLEKLRQTPGYEDLQPSDILLVDDRPENLQSAAELGIQTLYYKYGQSLTETFQHAFYTPQEEAYLDQGYQPYDPSITLREGDRVVYESFGLKTTEVIGRKVGSEGELRVTVYNSASIEPSQVRFYKRPEMRMSVEIAAAKTRFSAAEKEAITAHLIAGLQTRLQGSPGERTAMDIGAGNGTVTQALAPFFGKITAIEKDTARTAELKQRGIPHLEIATANFFEQMNQTDPASIDFILASHSFGLYFPFKQRDSLLEQTMRTVKKSGYLALVLNSHEEQRGNNVEIRNRFMTQHRSAKAGAGTNMEEVLKRWGYPLEVEKFSIVHETSSRDEMIAMALALLPVDDREKASTQKAIGEYVNSVLKVPGTSNYRLLIDQHIVWVSGDKTSGLASAAGEQTADLRGSEMRTTLDRKTVALTGAAGNLGSYLLDQLANKAAKVNASMMPQEYTPYKKFQFVGQEKVNMRTAVLPDFKHQKDLVANSDVILHMGGLVTSSLTPPGTPLEKFLYVNSFPLAIFVAQSRFQNRKPRIVAASSIQIYDLIDWKNGFPADHALKESDLKLSPELQAWVLQTTDLLMELAIRGDKKAEEKIRVYLEAHPAPAALPQHDISRFYALSKAVSEKIISRYENGLALRIGGVYGPGYDAPSGVALNDRMVSQYFYQAVKGQPIRVTNVPKHYLYIDDASTAVLNAATASLTDVFRDGELHVVNVGTPALHSARDIAEAIVKVTGSKSEIIDDAARQDSPRLLLDLTQMEKILGERSRITLEEGILKHWKWMSQTSHDSTWISRFFPEPQAEFVERGSIQEVLNLVEESSLGPNEGRDQVVEALKRARTAENLGRTADIGGHVLQAREFFPKEGIHLESSVRAREALKVLAGKYEPKDTPKKRGPKTGSKRTETLLLPLRDAVLEEIQRLQPAHLQHAGVLRDIRDALLQGNIEKAKAHSDRIHGVPSLNDLYLQIQTLRPEVRVFLADHEMHNGLLVDVELRDTEDPSRGIELFLPAQSYASVIKAGASQQRLSYRVNFKRGEETIPLNGEVSVRLGRTREVQSIQDGDLDSAGEFAPLVEAVRAWFAELIRKSEEFDLQNLEAFLTAQQGAQSEPQPQPFVVESPMPVAADPLAGLQQEIEALKRNVYGARKMAPRNVDHGRLLQDLAAMENLSDQLLAAGRITIQVADNYVWLANQQSKEANHEKAWTLLNKGLELAKAHQLQDPEKAIERHFIGYFINRLSRRDRTALGVARELQSRYPKYVSAEEVGRLYLKEPGGSPEVTEALSHLNEIIAITGIPLHQRYVNWREEVVEHLRAAEAAADRALAQAETVPPQLVETYLRLGVQYAHRNDNERGNHFIEKGLELIQSRNVPNSTNFQNRVLEFFTVRMKRGDTTAMPAAIKLHGKYPDQVNLEEIKRVPFGSLFRPRPGAPAAPALSAPSTRTSAPATSVIPTAAAPADQTQEAPAAPEVSAPEAPAPRAEAPARPKNFPAIAARLQSHIDGLINSKTTQNPLTREEYEKFLREALQKAGVTREDLAGVNNNTVRKFLATLTRIEKKLEQTPGSKMPAAEAPETTESGADTGRPVQHKVTTGSIDAHIAALRRALNDENMPEIQRLVGILGPKFKKRGDTVPADYVALVDRASKFRPEARPSANALGQQTLGTGRSEAREITREHRFGIRVKNKWTHDFQMRMHKGEDEEFFTLYLNIYNVPADYQDYDPFEFEYSSEVLASEYEFGTGVKTRKGAMQVLAVLNSRIQATRPFKGGIGDEFEEFVRWVGGRSFIRNEMREVEMAGAKWRRYEAGANKPWVIAVEPFDEIAMRELIDRNEVNIDWLHPDSEPLTNAQLLRALEVSDKPYRFLAGFVNYNLKRPVLEKMEAKLKAAKLDGLPKGLPLMSTGINNLDKDAANELGYQITNAPGILTQSMLEMNAAAMLSGQYRLWDSLTTDRRQGMSLEKLYQQDQGYPGQDAILAEILFGQALMEIGKLKEKDKYARSGDWKNTAVGTRAPSHQLLGYDEVVKVEKTLGILGRGPAVEAILRMASALGVKKINWMPGTGHGSPKKLAASLGIELREVGLEDLIGSDVIIRMPLYSKIKKSTVETIASRGGILVDPERLYVKPQYFDTLFESSLKGQTIGIAGFGNIGEPVARFAAAVGMKILVHQRNPERPVYQEKKIRTDAALAQNGLPPMQYVSLEDLFRHSHVITPLLSDAPPHVISRQLLENAPLLRLFINTDRGFFVDEAALRDLLLAHYSITAFLDVLEGESKIDTVPIETSPIFGIPTAQVLITGHTGSKEVATRRAMTLVMIKNLLAMIHGEEPANPVKGNEVWKQWAAPAELAEQVLEGQVLHSQKIHYRVVLHPRKDAQSTRIEVIFKREGFDDKTVEFVVPRAVSYAEADHRTRGGFQKVAANLLQDPDKAPAGFIQDALAKIQAEFERPVKSEMREFLWVASIAGAIASTLGVSFWRARAETQRQLKKREEVKARFPLLAEELPALISGMLRGPFWGNVLETIFWEQIPETQLLRWEQEFLNNDEVMVFLNFDPKGPVQIFDNEAYTHSIKETWDSQAGMVRPEKFFRRLSLQVRTEARLQDRLLKDTRASVWLETLQRLQKANRSKGQIEEIAIELKKGTGDQERTVVLKMPVLKEAFTAGHPLNESTHRYLASWIYYAAIQYGAQTISINTAGLADFLEITDLLHNPNKLGNIRDSHGEITHSPFGIQNYGNAGNVIRFVETQKTFKVPDVSRWASSKGLVLDYPGIYVGVDIGGGSGKFGVWINGVYVRLPKELQRLATKTADYESGTQYVARVTKHLQKIQAWLQSQGHGKISGVGIDMPGAADLDHNRMATIGQIANEKKWTEKEIQEVYDLTPSITRALGVPAIVRNDMDGVQTGIAAILEKAKPEFWARTKGFFRLDWMGTGHGHQFAMGGLPMPGPTEGGHVFVDFGKPGDPIYDTESNTSIPNMVRVAIENGFPKELLVTQERNEDGVMVEKLLLQPIGDAAAGLAYPEYKAAADKALQVFAKAYAQNLIMGYQLTQNTGIGNGIDVLLGGGITLGQTGSILKQLTEQELEKHGYKDKIRIEVFTEAELNAVLEDPKLGPGPLGSAALIQAKVREEDQAKWEAVAKTHSIYPAARQNWPDFNEADFQQQIEQAFRFNGPVYRTLQSILRLRKDGNEPFSIKVIVADGLEAENYGVFWTKTDPKEIHFVLDSALVKKLEGVLLSMAGDKLTKLSVDPDLRRIAESDLGFVVPIPGQNGNVPEFVEFSTVAAAFINAQELRAHVQAGAVDHALEVLASFSKSRPWPIQYLIPANMEEALFQDEIHDYLGIMNHLIFVAPLRGTPHFDTLIAKLKGVFPAVKVDRALEYTQSHERLASVVYSHRPVTARQVIEDYLLPAHELIGREILRQKLVDELGEEIESKIEWQGLEHLFDQILNETQRGRDVRLDISQATIIPLSQTQYGQGISFEDWKTSQTKRRVDRIRINNLALTRVEFRSVGPQTLTFEQLKVTQVFRAFVLPLALALALIQQSGIASVRQVVSGILGRPAMAAQPETSATDYMEALRDQKLDLNTPVRLVLAYESLSDITDSKRDVLEDFLTKNPQAALMIYSANTDKDALRAFQGQLQQNILNRRKALKISNKNVNLSVAVSEAEAAQFVSGQQISSLVYGNRRGLLDQWQQRFQAAERRTDSKVFLVEDNRLAGEPLKEAAELLATLKELLSSQRVPQGVISAGSLLAQNLQILGQVRALLAKSA